jgi:hypothetical protein
MTENNNLPAEVTKQAATLTEQAQALEIVDHQSYEQAATIFKGAKGLVKEIKEFFKPIKQAQDAAKRVTLDKEKSELKGPEEASKILGAKMAAWNSEQKRIRDEAERKAREAAEKEAEEQRLREAEEAEAAGDTELADEILDQPIAPVAPQLPPEPEKLKGVSYRTTWSAEVVDMMSLINYVAGKPELAYLLDANMPNLNRMAVSQKDSMQIPGVRAVPKTTTV